MIANLITLSRGLLGLLVIPLALKGAWSGTFWIIMLGHLTDILDGEVARRFGRSASGSGYDRTADNVLAYAMVIGLLSTRQLPVISLLWIIPVIIPYNLYLLPCPGKGMIRTAVICLRRLGRWTVFAYITFMYAAIAYGSDSAVKIAIVSAPVIGMIACVKRERIRKLLGGQPRDISLATNARSGP